MTSVDPNGLLSIETQKKIVHQSQLQFYKDQPQPSLKAPLDLGNLTWAQLIGGLNPRMKQSSYDDQYHPHNEL